MRPRVLLLLALPVIAALGACGTVPPKQAPGTTAPTTARPPATAGSTIAGPSCLELGKAVETVTTTDDAELGATAAAAIRSYDPPDDVDAALDTLVDAIGASATDTGATEAATTLYAWIAAVCS